LPGRVAPTFAHLVKSRDVSNADRRVIALGNLAGELKTSLEAAVRAVGLELLLTREPARAFVELERDGALAVLVDMATLGAEQFCKRARGTERLRSVPVIGMSRHPNELGFARVFAWGADDLVPLGARMPLERRLLVLRDTPAPDTTGFGQAVVAEATTQRRALVGRVLAHAGYDVKFAVDRGAVELYASQSETRLVVISAALGDPRRIIENAARAGALPTWIVTVEARSTQRLAASLTGLDRVAVTSTAGAPEDVLFLANELVFSKGARRREWRALYATPVAFRPRGGDGDEYGFSYDASPSGLYVRSLLPVSTDDVEVELRLPNRDERVRLSGKVARRFAFGSGAIASAPPGFSVKLEGPAAELSRWTQACTELIAAASSSESMAPPKARSASQPVLASPELGAKEVQLAVPPATVSIESVVAPLPVSMQAAVNEGSDVGELLAATLDEQTLTEVGTRPVTIDPDTLGVREERPSEFAINSATVLADSPPASLPAPLEPTISLPPVPAPAPPPAPSTKKEPPEALATPRTVLLDPVPRPAPKRRTTEPKTALGTVIMERAPNTGPETPRAMDWESDAKTVVRASQPSLEAPVPPEPASPPPPQTEPQFPAAKAEPVRAESPPAPVRTPEPEAQAVAFAPTEPPPPETEVEPHTLRVAQLTPAPSPLAVPSVKKTLPMGIPKQAPPTAETAGMRTLPSTPPAPLAPAAAKAAKASPPPAAPKQSTGARVLKFAAAAVGATAVGMGLALMTHQPSKGAAVRPVESVATAMTEPPITATSSASASASGAPATAGEASALPSTTSAAPSAAETSEAALASATIPRSVPSASAPTFDVNKLPRDRAALIVHSSASAHVFVHGNDYGETNQTLMTSCGIRFVRLGRALGDFVEPGQSYVIKCGRLNELHIEPTP
jgi:hypothetical protein